MSLHLQANRRRTILAKVLCSHAIDDERDGAEDGGDSGGNCHPVSGSVILRKSSSARRDRVEGRRYEGAWIGAKQDAKDNDGDDTDDIYLQASAVEQLHAGPTDSLPWARSVIIADQVVRIGDRWER